MEASLITGNVAYDITCKSESNGKTPCTAVGSNGESTTEYFVVRGMEAVYDFDPTIVGTYNGIGTISWSRSGEFLANWQRAGIY